MGLGRVGTSNGATTTGLEYKHKSIVIESSVSLVSVRRLDEHHPTISMPSGHGGRSIIIKKKNILFN